MKKEKTVRTYQRRTKTGKVVTVKQHTAKYDAAEALKEATKKKGAGDELEALKKKKPVAQKEEVKSPYEEYGFTKDDFKEWYEGTGSKADKKVEKALKKAMGAKAYNALSDKAADEYKKGGAHRFFTKGLEEMKASTSVSTKSVTPTKETKALEQRSKDIAKMVEGQKAQMKKAGIDPDKRLSGKKATEAKKDLVSKGFTQKKDEYGDTYLMKGKDVYHYIPSGVVMGGAKLDKITGGKDYDKAKKLFGAEKSSTSADMKSVNSGKAPQGDQTVSASMLRGTKKEKVTLTGKSVKDSLSDSLLRIGKRKDGSYDIFESSDNGKSWSYAEGWKDAGDYKGTAESSLARKNGFKIVKDGGIAKLVSKESVTPLKEDKPKKPKAPSKKLVTSKGKTSVGKSLGALKKEGWISVRPGALRVGGYNQLYLVSPDGKKMYKVKSTGTYKDTEATQPTKKVLAAFKRARKANSQRAERASSYEKANANISMD